MSRLATPRACAACKIEFTPLHKKRHQRFCSQKCVWKGVRGPEFNAIVSRGSIKKRADAMRGTGSGKSYRKRDGRHEHRVVAEQMLGRPLLRGEIVHHIDHNKQNNDPSNLEVMTQARHAQIHFLEYWKERKAANERR